MKLYKVFYRVNDKEDSVSIYKDWSFRDVYRSILRELKFKALLEGELAAFEKEIFGMARVSATIYKDNEYKALIAADVINGMLCITAIRIGDSNATTIRCVWN